MGIQKKCHVRKIVILAIHGLHHDAVELVYWYLPHTSHIPWELPWKVKKNSHSCPFFIFSWWCDHDLSWPQQKSILHGDKD
jgi:hypothetical protein